jgi:hypothetical protein
MEAIRFACFIPESDERESVARGLSIKSGIWRSTGQVPFYFRLNASFVTNVGLDSRGSPNPLSENSLVTVSKGRRVFSGVCPRRNRLSERTAIIVGAAVVLVSAVRLVGSRSRNVDSVGAPR